MVQMLTFTYSYTLSYCIGSKDSILLLYPSILAVVSFLSDSWMFYVEFIVNKSDYFSQFVAKF